MTVCRRLEDEEDVRTSPVCARSGFLSLDNRPSPRLKLLDGDSCGRWVIDGLRLDGGENFERDIEERLLGEGLVNDLSYSVCCR